MSRIYRSMKRDADDKPVVADNAAGLGIRPSDIPVDPEGWVEPGTGGLSVAPHWRDLPVELIPKRLADKLPGALGRNSMACFAFGEGPFENTSLTPGLSLRIDTEIHGLVEPRIKMQFEEFRKSIKGTREKWTISEE
jgi:hypothetical protein